MRGQFSPIEHELLLLLQLQDAFLDGVLDDKPGDPTKVEKDTTSSEGRWAGANEDFRRIGDVANSKQGQKGVERGRGYQEKAEKAHAKLTRRKRESINLKPQD